MTPFVAELTSLFSAQFGQVARPVGRAVLPMLECKLMTAALADSRSQMVRDLRSYKAQIVEGGLGKGGKLKVSE